MILSGEIKQLGTIICSLFFQFTHNLKKQISTISYYPSEKFLVMVVNHKRGEKKSGEHIFCILCPEANKTPTEMVNLIVSRASQGAVSNWISSPI